ncbi:hypothetical protein T01_4725 [Trichinella spiralis]|uniref:Uncharacterized protein n=1 Tax=Trichinella spiralis TaxID=6334 RepID=A0A0V1BJQ0_TRISP|nr:hypothetical protein T01_4725 [Trichinella spiralis]
MISASNCVPIIVCLKKYAIREKEIFLENCKISWAIDLISFKDMSRTTQPATGRYAVFWRISLETA